MCLYTSQKKSLIAKKDITCYKVVHWDEVLKQFRSEIRLFKYKIGHTYRLRKGLRQWVPNDFGYVYSGFHSFTTLKNALEYGGKHMVLLKCVIPKGARYYAGGFVQGYYDAQYTGGFGTQYCSNQIRIVAWKPMWRGKWSTEWNKES